MGKSPPPLRKLSSQRSALLRAYASGTVLGRMAACRPRALFPGAEVTSDGKLLAPGRERDRVIDSESLALLPGLVEGSLLDLSADDREQLVRLRER